MFQRIACLLPILLFALACGSSTSDVSSAPQSEGAGTASAGTDDAAVAAELPSGPITVAELDAYIRDQLFQRETDGGKAGKLYELRTRYLDAMLNERVVRSGAAEKGLPEDDFLQQELDKQGAITDEEIASFYEENKDRLGDQELEELAPRIRTHLDTLRLPQVLASLRESAGARIVLEPTRFEMEAVGPSRGPEDARVTIVEFSDFQCPYCQRVIPTMQALRDRYPDEVRIVYRHLPLDRIHPRARAAAEASLCADDQGQFWAYHDKLFESRNALSDEDLKKYAVELGLDESTFAACYDEGTKKELVAADLEAARDAGLSGTPAFFVNGILVTGAKPVEEFVALIDEELARSEGG